MFHTPLVPSCHAGGHRLSAATAQTASPAACRLAGHLVTCCPRPWLCSAVRVSTCENGRIVARFGCAWASRAAPLKVALKRNFAPEMGGDHDLEPGPSVKRKCGELVRVPSPLGCSRAAP